MLLHHLSERGSGKESRLGGVTFLLHRPRGMKCLNTFLPLFIDYLYPVYTVFQSDNHSLPDPNRDEKICADKKNICANKKNMTFYLACSLQDCTTCFCFFDLNASTFSFYSNQ